MSIRITSDEGYIILGKFRVSWGNALTDRELPGFFNIEAGRYSLEFGDIDQGKPGIYLTRTVNSETERLRTFWQAK